MITEKCGKVTKGLGGLYEIRIAEDGKISRLSCRAKGNLKRDEEKLQQIVEFLLKHETMTGAQFEACMQGEPIPEESGDTILFDSAE